MKLFFFIESSFYSSVWIVNALSIVCSEILKLSRNNQNIELLGVPPNTLPLVIYIEIFCYWVLLHYNVSFKTIASGFNGAFWWYGPLSEDREKFKQIYQNYLVALRAFFLLSFDTKHMMISQCMIEKEKFKLMRVKIDLRRIMCVELIWPSSD